MVAKLSKLQRQILIIALRNYSEETKDERADCFAADVLCEHYGFTPVKPLRNQYGCLPRGRLFKPSQAELRHYKSSQRATYRTFARLAGRGLVERPEHMLAWTGVKLSWQGILIAKALN